MTIWTNSTGVVERKPLIEAFLKQKLLKLKFTTTIKNDDICIGWGNKAKSKKLQIKALQAEVRYLQLEDGFISYIGHPEKKGFSVSLVVDDKGIYYDARQASKLESLILASLTSDETERVQQLISAITQQHITKYNCYEKSELPQHFVDNLNFDGRKCVLLVDQVSQDLSIEGAMANETVFLDMVDAARRAFPNARLLLKTHPDTRLGNKKGILARLNLPDVENINEHFHPHALIKNIDVVYTVSSLLGFEALLHKKTVYCFGLPFYAGWGLTNDVLTCPRRSVISLEQLVHAALIKYSLYFNPVTRKKCELEEIIQLVSLQIKQKNKLSHLYLLGFSLWKRSFITRFSAHLAHELSFVNKVPKRLKANENILVWGNKFPDLLPCIRVEDGFIRSNGLGAGLHRPSSLTIDQRGIYFDSQKTNDLERLLNRRELSAQEINRAQSLINAIKQTGVCKYNVGQQANIDINSGNKKVILVVGQVDDDASITLGSSHIKNNSALLQHVKAANNNAFIIYKPHPDVVSGHRRGKIPKNIMETCIDQQIDNLPLSRLFSKVDELHTISSLSGFEALPYNVNVHVWGQPFYAGWGLTTDYYPPKRRERKLTLFELVYLTLIEYPLYIDWKTGLWISPEMLINELSSRSPKKLKKQFWLTRQIKKLFYLVNTTK